jgi:SAM-dependent methyltransferase
MWRDSLKRNLRNFVKTKLDIPEAAFPIFFPYRAGARSFILPKLPAPGIQDSAGRVPPKNEWISDKYGNTPEEYLASGKRDLQAMEDILIRAGISLADQGNILEFGCGDGRMIRWLEDLAHTREVWGVDIDAGRVFWCKQNLSPRLHFATTTTLPHLPFEDHYFGFIFAGSVFTHIDDLAAAWIAELRRILRPRGKLFITVHLKNDIPLLSGKYRDSGLAKLLRRYPEYEEFKEADFDMFSIGRSAQSYVFYDLDYLRKMIEPMLKIRSVTSEVRLYQNALLLERV